MPQSYHHGYGGYEYASHHYPAYITINNQLPSGHELKPNEYGVIYHTELKGTEDSLDVERSPPSMKTILDGFPPTCRSDPNRSDISLDYTVDESPFASPHTNTVTSEHVQELDSMCHLTDAKEKILQSNYGFCFYNHNSLKYVS